MILSISIILLTCANSHNALSEYDDEIDKNIRNEISDTHARVFDAFIRKDASRIKQLAYLKYYNRISGALEQTLNALSGLLSQYKFTKLYDCYVTRINTGSNNAFPLVSLEPKHFIVNQFVMPGDASYLSFLKSTNKKGIQYLMMIHYTKQNGKWLLASLYAGDYSIQGMDARDLYKLSKIEYNKKHYMSAALYSLAMNRLIRPKPFLQYVNEKEMKDQLKKSIKRFNSGHKFPVKISGISLNSINIQFSKSGISPVFIYTTKLNLNAKRKIESEARKAFPAILKTFPDIKNPFEYSIMQAYNEMPKDPNKKYHIYRTIIKH